MTARDTEARVASELERIRYERGELVGIARAISQERDIGRLLDLILEKCRYITGADAGSIYVLEEEPGRPGERRLHFRHSQNDSIDYESSDFFMPVDTESIAGTAVVRQEPINIADVYEVDADDSVPYGFDESFDERTGYRTLSMLTVPMISAEDEVIGVIQLINKKRDPKQRLVTPDDVTREVVAFDERSEELACALAAQAGIALENALLYDEIRAIFEGFVHASVQAIEQRDPTTSGHSQRVSVLSCALAETVDRIDAGRFADARFSSRDMQELKYAALLHDFGKIGVREQVLVKAKKLYPHEREAIRMRVDFALKAAEADLLKDKLRCIQQGGGQTDLDALQERYEARRAELLQAWDLIDRANEPTVLSEGDFSRIAEVASLSYEDLEGRRQRLLSDTEAIALKVTRGSLSPREIDEIRSHVDHTYAFLTKIPWGKSMRRIPDIARAHHEKLDGSGYPQGVREPEIPLPSKIMTIADIYDALTASDRPYKKALAVDRALSILGFEVDDGHLDAELVQIFREAEVYRLV
ncbi:MAG: HD domain-containing phosphohydrolase [Myxococcales bacterium]|jgi:HD-GYP domain-containing protein (c-di-GMP phosphodiesterase class II)